MGSKGNVGGAREGAGRKPIDAKGGPRVTRSIVLSQVALDRVDKIAGRNGVSRSLVIDALIKSASLTTKVSS